jgi:mono/diheme cytochrome c family protein
MFNRLFRKKSQEGAMRERRLSRRSTLAVAGLSALMLVGRLTAQQVQPAPEQHAGTYSQADIQSGSVVYAAQCTSCHGPTGDQVSTTTSVG